MKNVLFCGLLVSVAAFTSGVSAKTINVGVIEYSPHINVKGKAISGKTIDYVTNVLKGIGMEPKFTAYTARRAKAEMGSGRFDLLLPFEGENKAGKNLTKPLFHATPGLCFKKEKFISILSAVHRFKGLSVGYSAGSSVVDDLKNSGAKLKPIQGKATMKRGIEMLTHDRYDAIYHPNPVKVYNLDSPEYDKIACSYFYGHSSAVYISASGTLAADQYSVIDAAFTKALNEKSYEFYFAEGK